MVNDGHQRNDAFHTMFLGAEIQIAPFSVGDVSRLMVVGATIDNAISTVEIVFEVRTTLDTDIFSGIKKIMIRNGLSDCVVKNTAQNIHATDYVLVNQFAVSTPTGFTDALIALSSGVSTTLQAFLTSSGVIDTALSAGADPTVSPPALVSPHSYVMPYEPVTITAGTPRLVAERFSRSGFDYLWYPGLVGFGYSGKLMVCANISPDSAENSEDEATIFRSSDFGYTWDANLQYDIPYIRAAGGEPRWYENGRIRELGSIYRADPIGQARNFCTHRSYYANGGSKVVRYPWTTHIRGLPQDIKPYTSVQYPTTVPRNASYQIYAFSDVLRLPDNSLITTLYVFFVGDAYCTQVVIRSTDDGNTWNYLSTIGGAASGLNEASMCRLTNGHIIHYARRNGLGSPDIDSMRYCISTDNGNTWSTPVIAQSVTAHGNAGIQGYAPKCVQLDNGIIIVAHGPVNGHCLSVCIDGGEGGGLGAGGASVWQRWQLVDHHNLYAQAGTVANDNLGAGLVRKYRSVTAHESSWYLSMVKTGPNRVTVCYDYTPSGRTAIGSVTQEPHQIYCMDIDVN